MLFDTVQDKVTAAKALSSKHNIPVSLHIDEEGTLYMAPANKIHHIVNIRREKNLQYLEVVTNERS